MSDQNGNTNAHNAEQADNHVAIVSPDKGKGKTVEQVPDVSMEDEEEESSEGESGVEEDNAIEPEDEDNMEEIDTNNIITDGRRTRGKAIDFAKAAQEAGDEDEDEEEDGDFEEEDHDEMKD